MPAETQKIAMQLDADTRFSAAAGGVGRYFADAAGLANSAVSSLQSAIVAVCNRELERIKDSTQRLAVILTRTPDRIEVVMKRRAIGDSGKEEQGTIPGVDRVQHETQAEMEITRLTKYVGEQVSAG
ncbi:MAG TPA: hypothetical protein VN850_05420 [Candidatus Acidoferrales bacterium]|nr:hypothetical protein [Candidatus Acidoferrales bacterium]